MGAGTKLRTLQSQLLRILEDKGLPTGTVRRWGGDDFVKKSNGNWLRLPKKKVSSGMRPVLPGMPPPRVPVQAPAPAPKVAPVKPKAVPPSHTKAEIPTGRKWVEYVPGLPKNTAATYTKGGKYTAERSELHQKIASDFTSHVAPVPDHQQPVALFTMGAPASGKSSAMRGLDLSSFVQIDSDAIKEKLPEYHKAVQASARNAAAMVHDESSDVAKMVLSAASNERKNLVFDGTGKTASSHINKMKQLKEMGYRIHLVMTDLDEETGVKRAMDRAEQTGRYVPEKIIRDAYKVVPKNFEEIAQHADDAALFDTRNGPRLVFKKKDGNHEDVDQEFMTKFRDQHGKR